MTSALVSNADRVLLFNPAVHDTRIHWARWHQPNTLLRLATWFRQNGAEVRLVDALYRLPDERLRRERVRTFLVDGEPVHTWRFGQTRAALARELRALSKGGWIPDLVYVECFTTLWWEGAAEAVTLVRVAFPHARVIILGGYPQVAAAHALHFTAADEVWTTTPPQLARLRAWYADDTRPPTMAYVYLGGGRTPCEIVDEVSDAAARKIQHFAFPEHDVAGRFPDSYPATLEALARRRLRVSLYSLGSIAPGALTRRPDLAGLMRRAGYKQVAFADDREAPITREADDALVDTYQKAASLCRDAGFRERSEALSAGICVGRLGESVAARARVITCTGSARAIVAWAGRTRSSGT